MKEVERESSGEVRLEIGSLYRLLGRLLNDGLLEMGDGDGRRQYYSLSRLGRKFLRQRPARRPASFTGTPGSPRIDLEPRQKTFQRIRILFRIRQRYVTIRPYQICRVF